MADKNSGSSLSIDPETVAAWELGTKVAVLQAQGVQNLTRVLTEEIQNRDLGDLRLSDQLTAFKECVEERFSQMGLEIMDLRARVRDEVAAREVVERELADERTNRQELMRQREKEEITARAALKDSILREERVRREQDLHMENQLNQVDAKLTRLEASAVAMAEVDRGLEEKLLSQAALGRLQQQQLEKCAADWQARHSALGEDVGEMRQRHSKLEARLSNTEGAHVALEKLITEETNKRKATDETQDRTVADLAERMDSLVKETATSHNQASGMLGACSSTMVVCSVADEREERSRLEGQLTSMQAEVQKQTTVKARVEALEGVVEILSDRAERAERARIELEGRLDTESSTTKQGLDGCRGMIAATRDTIHLQVEAMVTNVKSLEQKTEEGKMAQQRLTLALNAEEAARKLIERRVEIMKGGE
ncbi:hypothetical protein CYMTET_26876 [Cymbomonas tetramitiformis]|uniref:Uncharacterized protein n=1 Tax=Cymbomonas tetramitiformis TaxID=36881 RepID=A0AAE0FQV0_9CHLO|nr:hypothetical protein CYMTET_26876 [Cymbomonas tetramitiformis]|eukprot:gene16437-19513_t